MLCWSKDKHGKENELEFRELRNTHAHCAVVTCAEFRNSFAGWKITSRINLPRA